MRTSTLLSTLLLPLTILAAKKESGDRFTDALSKSYPIKLDDTKFQKLTAGPRDYASVVLLTALEPRFGCAACRDFQPEWELLAKSWQKGDKAGESRVVFSTLDFADGKGTFQSVRLRVVERNAVCANKRNSLVSNMRPF
jgi:oligosaccharyltransferase complex subunit gamma